MHWPDPRAPGYDCPFCLLQEGVQNELNQAGEVIAVTELAFARISPMWWPDMAGAALVMPRVHAFPRYADDGLYVRDTEATFVEPPERAPYAELLAAEIGLPRTFS